MAPEYYIFTGGVVPFHVTHVLIDKSLKFVRKRAFYNHPNIEEVICHDGVEKIEEYAFHNCPRLRRAIMPGVKEVVLHAFNRCEALTYIECSKLERIGEYAFHKCTSLNSIDLPSAKIVGGYAFRGCTKLENANFGKELESIRENAFYYCLSLERITLPLKDGMVSDDTSGWGGTFLYCEKLNHIDLVEGVHETVAALLMEEWKNDMNEEIDAISQILPNTRAGSWKDPGGKAQAIRRWITSVLRKYNHYKAEHRRHLNVAAATLQQALPNDIVMKNILPFLELPPHTFDGED